MEQPRDWILEQVVALREDMGELQAKVAHLGTDLSQARQDARTEFSAVRSEVADVRQGLRRLDARVFQLLLGQVATLATMLTTLVALLVR